MNTLFWVSAALGKIVQMSCIYLTTIISVNSCGFCSNISCTSAFLLKLEENGEWGEKKRRGGKNKTQNIGIIVTGVYH